MNITFLNFFQPFFHFLFINILGILKIIPNTMNDILMIRIAIIFLLHFLCLAQPAAGGDDQSVLNDRPSIVQRLGMSVSSTLNNKKKHRKQTNLEQFIIYYSYYKIIHYIFREKDRKE